MKGYYNKRELTYSIKAIELQFIIDLYRDYYKYTFESNPTSNSSYKLLNWLCQENLIGRELTPEIYALWELSKEN